MSVSTRRHDAPVWLRIKMIAFSRAHRAMKRQYLKQGTHVCPAVSEKIAEVRRGDLSLTELEAWLGQLHTDYVGALEQTQEKLVKTRFRNRTRNTG